MIKSTLHTKVQQVCSHSTCRAIFEKWQKIDGRQVEKHPTYFKVQIRNWRQDPQKTHENSKKAAAVVQSLLIWCHVQHMEGQKRQTAAKNTGRILGRET